MFISGPGILQSSHKHTRSLLFGNTAQLNLQFDMLDLNTGFAPVVRMINALILKKTLPDGTFSLIWVNREGIYTEKEYAVRQRPVCECMKSICQRLSVCQCLYVSSPTSKILCEIDLKCTCIYNLPKDHYKIM